MGATIRDRIEIRPAVRADARLLHEAIRGLARHLDAEHKIRSSVDDIERHGFGEPPAFEALIAETDSDFAGMCLFFPSFSTWIGKPGVYVQDIYVAPRFRGAGVGEALIRRTAALARSRGCAYMRLSVDADNPGAQGFYERLGMSWSQAERIMMARDGAFEALADEGGAA